MLLGAGANFRCNRSVPGLGAVSGMLHPVAGTSVLTAYLTWPVSLPSKLKVGLSPRFCPQCVHLNLLLWVQRLACLGSLFCWGWTARPLNIVLG